MSNHDVRVGDVVAAERPFVLVCLPESYETHCYHCLTRTLAPIPCTKTSSVVFCSKVSADVRSDPAVEPERKIWSSGVWLEKGNAKLNKRQEPWFYINCRSVDPRRGTRIIASSGSISTGWGSTGAAASATSWCAPPSRRVIRL